MSMRNEPSSFKSIRFLRIKSAYFGSPYGARPMTLYSPEFTRKPVKYVNAEYSRPTECGNRCCFNSSIVDPRPTPIDEVAHSPTPSIVRIAAFSKGDG